MVYIFWGVNKVSGKNMFNGDINEYKPQRAISRNNIPNRAYRCPTLNPTTNHKLTPTSHKIGYQNKAQLISHTYLSFQLLKLVVFQTLYNKKCPQAHTFLYINPPLSTLPHIPKINISL